MKILNKFFRTNLQRYYWVQIFIFILLVTTYEIIGWVNIYQNHFYQFKFSEKSTTQCHYTMQQLIMCDGTNYGNRYQWQKETGRICPYLNYTDCQDVNQSINMFQITTFLMLGNVTILVFSVAIKLCNNDVGCLSYFINKTFQLIFYLAITVIECIVLAYLYSLKSISDIEINQSLYISQIIKVVISLLLFIINILLGISQIKYEKQLKEQNQLTNQRNNTNNEAIQNQQQESSDQQQPINEFQSPNILSQVPEKTYKSIQKNFIPPNLEVIIQ